MNRHLSITILAIIILLPYSSLIQAETSQSDIGNEVLISNNDSLNKNEIAEKTAQLQIPFIKNEGQLKSKEILFYTKTFNGMVFLTDKAELVYSITSPKYYIGADDSLSPNGFPSQLIVQDMTEIPLESSFQQQPAINTEIKGLQPAATKINYIIDDESNWKDNIPAYDLISLGEIWKGVSYHLKATNKNIEKVFTVYPEGKVNSIQFKIRNVDSLKVTANGELQANVNNRFIVFTAPIAYQEVGGERKHIEVSYRILDNSSYGFNIGEYDKSLPLVIDPLLASTYIGGNGEDTTNGIALDAAGNIFISGFGASSNYPVTAGVFQGYYTVGYDIIISKFNNVITALLASTYIGGSLRSELAYALAIDGSGNVFVTGATGTAASTSIVPATAGAYDTTYNGAWDAFVAKLNNDLTSAGFAFTYLGGTDNDFGYAIEIDKIGNVIVAGQAGNSTFPATGGAYTIFGGGADGFVCKFNNNLNAVGFVSTYLGGNSTDVCFGVTVDYANNIIATGYTVSSNFPTIAGATDPTPNGSADVFVTRFANSLATTINSTLLGGSGWDVGVDVIVDSSNNIFVVGQTGSGNFPVVPNNSSSFGGTNDAFVTKFSSTLGSIAASRFIGGSGNEFGSSIAIGPFAGQVFMSGYTNSTNFPILPASPAALQVSLGGSSDVFIMRLSNNLAPIASTYLGGSLAELTVGLDNKGCIAVDNSANVYITGGTVSPNFPVISGSLYSTYAGGVTDAFVSKLTPDLRGGTAITTTPLSPPVRLSPADRATGETIPVVLAWSTPANAIAPVTYSLFFSTSSSPEAQVYSGNDTSFIIEQANYETTYYWYLVAIDGIGRNSWTSIWRFTTQINPLFITGSSGNQVLGENTFTKPLGSCFIASAVYNNPMNSNVVSLRSFRDNYLLTNIFGQAIVEKYYRISPSIANSLRGNIAFVKIIRFSSIPLIITVNHPIITLLVLIGLVLMVSLGYRKIFLVRNQI